MERDTTYSQQSNLLRHLNFRGLHVLQLGAEAEELSRFLAKESTFLHIVENSQEHYDALTVRLEGLTNWTGDVLYLQDYISSGEYDVVCLIGVLEHAAEFVRQENTFSPYDTILQLAKKHLKPGGALVIAAENKLGIKYWNAAPEDKTNRLFDSITGYGTKSGPKSFNRQELYQLCIKNGFSSVEEFYPFPDYRSPTTILHSTAFSLPSEVLAELACATKFSSSATTRRALYPDYLAALELTRAGLLQDFSNSFLFVAFKEGGNEIGQRLLQKVREENECAWYIKKRSNTGAVTAFKNEPDGWHVSKTLLSPMDPIPGLHWQAVNEKLVPGTSLRERLERAAYQQEWDIFTEELLQFLRWLTDKKAYINDTFFLVDAIWQNARKTREDEYQLFDQEWQIPIEDWQENDYKGWIVFRNIITLDRPFQHYWVKGKPWKTLKELYEYIAAQLGTQCNYNQYLQREAVFQSTSKRKQHRKMTRRKCRFPFLTNPVDWIILYYSFPLAARLRFLHGGIRKIQKK